MLEQGNESVEDEELSPSSLGSKEHWDSAYSLELDNFKAHGDVGEIWFGEDIMFKIVRCVEKYATAKKETRIVDLGCGNGMTLLELARLDYTNLVGVDYSPNSIALCESLFSNQDCPKVEFKVMDLLSENPFGDTRFSICLDKGTYDAVSLIPNEDQSLSRKKYLANVAETLDSPDGIFILASCNWTTDELTKQTAEWFTVHEVVKTPQFNFGGKVGNLVSLVVLKKIV